MTMIQIQIFLLFRAATGYLPAAQAALSRIIDEAGMNLEPALAQY
jgi:hypothetical protein